MSAEADGDAQRKRKLSETSVAAMETSVAESVDDAKERKEKKKKKKKDKDREEEAVVEPVVEAVEVCSSDNYS